MENGIPPVRSDVVSMGSAANAKGPTGGSLDSSLQQSQDMNHSFTTLSNVMKSEADTIKNAIGNLR